MNSVLMPTVDEQLLFQIIDAWCAKMHDDYRVNRFFCDRPLAEQTAPLKRLLSTLLGNKAATPQRLSELADEAFTAAFARGNAKPSLVSNRDFAFLGTLINGNIIGDDDGTLKLTLLCPAHSHFLKLQPTDDVYDVAVDLLQTTLDEMNVAHEIASQLTAFVASGKEGVMGKGKPLIEDEDSSSRFRTHG